MKESKIEEVLKNEYWKIFIADIEGESPSNTLEGVHVSNAHNMENTTSFDVQIIYKNGGTEEETTIESSGLVTTDSEGDVISIDKD